MTSDFSLSQKPIEKTRNLELWTLTNRLDETVRRCATRLRHLAHKYAKLPQDAQIIAELQQYCYFRRSMPPNWQKKIARCAILYETVNELEIYFERLERNERQTGRDCLNGRAIHEGEKGQIRRDQQHPSSDWRIDRRNHRDHRDTRQDYRGRPGLQGGKKTRAPPRTR